jgi:hypothetical protein
VHAQQHALGVGDRGVSGQEAADVASEMPEGGETGVVQRCARMYWRSSLADIGRARSVGASA